MQESIKENIETEAAFRCPVCQEPMEYGLKNCPTCDTPIFYRNISETFWNERKQTLLRQSPAISKL